MALILGLLAPVLVRAAPVTLAKGEGLAGRFEQSRFLRGFDKPIQSSGRFFVLPGTGLVWQTEQPFETRMVIDAKGISQSMDGAEVTRLGFDRFPALQILRNTMENSLSGNWKPLEELTGSELQPRGDKWTLRFTPKASGIDLPFAYLSFEMGTFLNKVEIVKANGDKDVITFSDQRTAPLADIQKAAKLTPEKKP